MLAPDDPFLDNFERTFEANYDPDTFQEEGANPGPDSSPISFYDLHIASNFLLKSVVYLPSITQLLSKAFEWTVQDFTHAGHKFPSLGYHVFPQKCRAKSFTDANNVQRHYDIYMANLGTRYASKLVLHPDSPNWDSILCTAFKAGESDLNFMAESWLMIDGQLEDQPVLFDSLSLSAKEQIKALELRCPRLATWDMFAMTETATGMFHKMARSSDFKWETSHTLGCRSISHLSLPPDARKTLLKIPRSARTKAKSAILGRLVVTKTSRIIVAPPLPTRRKQYRPDLRHYIQHAWATAVAHDATFFVLHCGRYERIGFRHRESQTLYLSAVIDTINARDPSYRKLNTGLYISILQDALQRLELLGGDEEKEKASSLKRTVECIDHEGVPKAKRRKGSQAPHAEIVTDMKKLSEGIATRKLAVVRLDYGAYASPIPSSFVRIGPTCVPGYAPLRVSQAARGYPKQSRYDVHERFFLTLKEPLGDGAVGVVHPAVAELTLESGEILRHNLAVKLAFSEKQQKALKNEYRVYGHLSRKDGVQGIPTVHGMFRDPELDTLAMVMSDAGRSLRDLELGLGKEGRKLSEAERKAFIDALSSLHRAGVRHNDIRPENLLINSEGQVSIIDLDRADFNVAERLLKEEISELNKVLNDWF